MKQNQLYVTMFLSFKHHMGFFLYFYQFKATLSDREVSKQI